MNKLVSKNPVQRFKLGNRIVKFQQAGKIYASRPREVHGAEVNGERVGYVEIPGKGYIAISPSGKAYNYNGNGAVGQLNFKPINLSNYDLYHIWRAAQTPGKITGFTSRDASAVANYWVTRRPSYQRVSPKTDKVVESSSKQSEPQKEVNSSSVTGQVIGKPSPAKSTMGTRSTNPVSFKMAFNTARNAGQETFNWRGQTYNTRNKGEENYVFQNGKWVNPTSNITFQAPEFQSERIEVPLTASVTSPATIIPETITAPQITYDRTGIRQLIRDRGFSPYQFSGAQRRALRMVMNGQGTDTDRAIVSGMGIFKKGGLISRNPIKRFKLNK